MVSRNGKLEKSPTPQSIRSTDGHPTYSKLRVSPIRTCSTVPTTWAQIHIQRRKNISNLKSITILLEIITEHYTADTLDTQIQLTDL